MTCGQITQFGPLAALRACCIINPSDLFFVSVMIGDFVTSWIRGQHVMSPEDRKSAIASSSAPRVSVVLMPNAFSQRNTKKQHQHSTLNPSSSVWPSLHEMHLHFSELQLDSRTTDAFLYGDRCRK